MAESIHTQVMNALVTALDAIAADGGTTYWYDVDSVAWVEAFDDDLLERARVAGAVYLLRAGDERHEESETGEGVRAHMEVFLLVGTRLGDTVAHAKVQDRLVRDALSVLWDSVQVAGLENIAGDELGIFVDRDRFKPGWALAEIRFEATYTYTGGTP